MDAKRSLVRKWLTKARRDLLSAKRLARGPDPYFDTAIYHCQQCVEKAVKGWLVYYDQSFEKTHDLRLLVTVASEIEPRFTEWFDVAEQISPYATSYRYPGELPPLIRSLPPADSARRSRAGVTHLPAALAQKHTVTPARRSA